MSDALHLSKLKNEHMNPRPFATVSILCISVLVSVSPCMSICVCLCVSVYVHLRVSTCHSITSVSLYFIISLFRSLSLCTTAPSFRPPRFNHLSTYRSSGLVMLAIRLPLCRCLRLTDCCAVTYH